MIKHKLKESLSKGEKDLINLSTGKKKPQNDKEAKLLADIDRIKKQGGVIQVPHD